MNEQQGGRLASPSGSDGTIKTEALMTNMSQRQSEYDAAADVEVSSTPGMLDEDFDFFIPTRPSLGTLGPFFSLLSMPRSVCALAPKRKNLAQVKMHSDGPAARGQQNKAYVSIR